jgi:hypothetical protein
MHDSDTHAQQTAGADKSQEEEEGTALPPNKTALPPFAGRRKSCSPAAAATSPPPRRRWTEEIITVVASLPYECQCLYSFILRSFVLVEHKLRIHKRFRSDLDLGG